MKHLHAVGGRAPGSGKTCDSLRLSAPKAAYPVELGGIVAWKPMELKAGLIKSLTFFFLTYSRETCLG